MKREPPVRLNVCDPLSSSLGSAEYVPGFAKEQARLDPTKTILVCGREARRTSILVRTYVSKRRFAREKKRNNVCEADRGS